MNALRLRHRNVCAYGSCVTAAITQPRMNGELFDERAAALGATTPGERAQLAGVDQSTLWRYRTGRLRPTIDTARLIADRIGVTVDELWPVTP